MGQAGNSVGQPNQDTSRLPHPAVPTTGARQVGRQSSRWSLILAHLPRPYVTHLTSLISRTFKKKILGLSDFVGFGLMRNA